MPTKKQDRRAPAKRKDSDVKAARREQRIARAIAKAKAAPAPNDRAEEQRRSAALDRNAAPRASATTHADEIQRRERYVLDWWRTNLGDLPRAPVTDPWAKPIASAGPAARLLVAPLDDEADANAFLRSMVRPKDAVVPDLPALRRAASLLRIVGLALVRGDAVTWAQIAKAYETVFEEATIRRLVILDAIDHAIATVERIRETSAWAASEGIADEADNGSSVLREAAAEALEVLVSADDAFAKLDVDMLVDEVGAAKRGDRAREGHWKGGSGNKYTAGIAARLAVRCGALGDTNVDRSRRAFLGARDRTGTNPHGNRHHARDGS